MNLRKDVDVEDFGDGNKTESNKDKVSTARSCAFLITALYAHMCVRVLHAHANHGERKTYFCKFQANLDNIAISWR